MRSGPDASVREGRHTPERKKQELTCAERPNRRCKGRKAHAREEKERANAALAEAGMPALDDNLDLNDIGGVEELGLDFVEDEKDKRNEKGSE